MRTIRPYELFSRLEGAPAHRMASVMLPYRRGLGGTSLLETALMIAAMKIVRAKRLFEFGTFLGTNALQFAANSPDDARVFTLDLAPGQDIDQHPEDRIVTDLKTQFPGLDFEGHPCASKIHALHGDSTTFDFSPWKNSLDFIFIDGGHDARTVRCDTENALVMLRKGGCIAWHDYSNPVYPELSGYLDAISNHRDLFHVGDTMLCFWFS